MWTARRLVPVPRRQKRSQALEIAWRFRAGQAVFRVVGEQQFEDRLAPFKTRMVFV
jgi:hypothetical protein